MTGRGRYLHLILTAVLLSVAPSVQGQGQDPLPLLDLDPLTGASRGSSGSPGGGALDDDTARVAHRDEQRALCRRQELVGHLVGRDLLHALLTN